MFSTEETIETRNNENAFCLPIECGERTEDTTSLSLNPFKERRRQGRSIVAAVAFGFSTRRLLLRSSRCFLIASGPPRWSAAERSVAPTTLIYGAPKQPAFSSVFSCAGWWTLMCVKEETRRHLSSSTSDSDEEEKDDEETEYDASSSNQKVLLYACYGINDWMTFASVISWKLR